MSHFMSICVSVNFTQYFRPSARYYTIIVCSKDASCLAVCCELTVSVGITLQ